VEYGEAARRIMEAGFDGVMIHGAKWLSCLRIAFLKFSTSGPMLTAATSKAAPSICWT